MEKFLLAGEAGRVVGCSAQNIVKLEKAGKLKVAFKTPSGVRLFYDGSPQIRSPTMPRSCETSKWIFKVDWGLSMRR